MKKNSLLMLFLFLSISCLAQKKDKFEVSLFKNIEKLKCRIGEIDGFLLRSGYFESKGRYNGVKTYALSKDYKGFIAINTFDNDDGYYFVSTSSDVYNYIIKNGVYEGTHVDNRGMTNLVYFINYDYYMLYKETFKNVKKYCITSYCIKNLSNE